MYLPVTIRIYGRNMVEIRKGAKAIHLNTFAEGKAGTEHARRFATRVASAISCGVEDELDKSINEHTHITSSPMSKAPEPTKAQRELLAWMVAEEDRTRGVQPTDQPWRGGDLIEFYSQRAVRAREQWKAGDRDKRGYMGSGGYASHGWRRAGGTALSNLARKGYAKWVGLHYGTALFCLTEEGRRIGREVLTEAATQAGLAGSFQEGPEPG